MFQLFLKKAFPHFIAILTILVVNMIYFHPQLDGKKIAQNDKLSNIGMGREARIYYENNGEFTLWTNSMFGGMPTYQISAYHYGNKIDWLEPIAQLFFSPPIGIFNALMLGAYLLFILLGVNPWLSIIGAIAFGLSTNNIVLWEAGHSSKLKVIATFAPVIAGTFLTFNKKYLTGGIIFLLGMSFNIFSNHQQMTYYLAMILGIYVLIQVFDLIKRKEFVDLAKISGVLTLGLILSITTSISNLYMVYDYSKDTVRGNAILSEPIGEPITNEDLVEEEGITFGGNASGLDWDYVTQFSNGVLDLFSGLIPGIVGGSSLEDLDPASDFSKSLTAKNKSSDKAPMYWGELPFTSGPNYYGAIICMLFVVGISLIRGPIMWWLSISVLLTLLISLGKNFEIFNYLLYSLLPMYNKFRAHPSILSLTAFLIPFLGILSLNKIINPKTDKKKILRALFVGGGITSAICLFFALLGPYIFDFINISEDAILREQGLGANSLISDRKALMRSEAFRSLIFILGAMGLIYAFVKEKIKTIVLLVSIGGLIVLDLFSVGQRYIKSSDFKKVAANSSEIPMRPVDKRIYAVEGIVLDSNGLPTGDNKVGRGAYRVLDVSIKSFSDAHTSYYHNTIGGYHPAKLRRFEDVKNGYFHKDNSRIMAMLNAKYYISKSSDLTQNSAALGSAWFVEDVYKVNNPDEEFKRLGNFQPATEAIVLDKEFNNYIGDFNPQKDGTINLVAYEPNRLEYIARTNSEQLAVFSEIWYGPNKGWQAYINDQPVNHIRANYLLRALRIPAGENKIRFEFQPKAFFIGNTISLIASILVFLMLIGFIAIKGKGLYEQLKIEEKTVKVRVKTKPVLKKATKKSKSKKSKRK